MRPGGLIKRRIDNAKVDFPDPDSPRQPESLAWREGKTDIVHRLHLAERVVEDDVQARDPAGPARSRTLSQARVGDLVEPDSDKEQAEKDRQDDHGRCCPPPPPAIDHRWRLKLTQ